MLAEAVSIDGGLLVVILIVLFVVAAAWCALVVVGCVCARRAGRGSRAALAVWAVVAVAQTLPLLIGFTGLAVAPIMALVLQAGFYLWARADAAGGR